MGRFESTREYEGVFVLFCFSVGERDSLDDIPCSIEATLKALNRRKRLFQSWLLKKIHDAARTGQPPATDATDATERLGLDQWADRIQDPCSTPECDRTTTHCRVSERERGRRRAGKEEDDDEDARRKKLMKKRKKETLKDQQQLRGVLFWSRANRSQRVDTQQQLRQVPQQHCSHHPCRTHFQNSFFLFFLFSPPTIPVFFPGLRVPHNHVWGNDPNRLSPNSTSHSVLFFEKWLKTTRK